QAGLSLQQDLALVALLGIAHSERNGHHYGRGLHDAPATERAAYIAAHPDLYDTDGHLRISSGVIAIESLHASGYANRADPDWQATQPLSTASTLL
ncbi:MAG: mandelate racemase, partial [Rhizobacter sp.]